MDEKVLSRFATKYEIAENGCWVWTRGKTPDGYGTMSVEGRTRYSHRLAYEHYIGPIPNGLQIDHLCRNRGCVNPNHLEAVTVGENVRRGNAGYASAGSPRGNRPGKTECSRGHPLVGENVGYRESIGRRFCVRCHRANYYRKSGRPVPPKWA